MQLILLSNMQMTFFYPLLALLVIYVKSAQINEIQRQDDISEEVKRCFRRQPYPCNMKMSNYPFSDQQLEVYAGNVNIPTGFPSDQKNNYTRTLSGVKMVKLYGLTASCLGYGQHGVLLRRMIEHYFVPFKRNPLYSIRKENIYGVNVKIYTPTKPVRGRRAGVFYIHGGGWVLGSSDEMEGFISKMVIDGDFVVMSVDYRLAPEHVFPAGFSDCVKAIKYFLRHAYKFNVDSSRVAIAGDSSGGNLAAAVALKLRDVRFRPSLALQVLVYPALQAIDFTTPSYQMNACDAYLDRSWMVEFWMWYALGDYPNEWLPKLVRNGHTPRRIKRRYRKLVQTDLLKHQLPRPEDEIYWGDERIWAKVKHTFKDPYFAPLMARSLKNLPNTYMMLSSNDVLHDDGEIYSNRLRIDGVAVHVDTVQALHALVDDPSLPYARQAIKRLTDYMVDILRR